MNTWQPHPISEGLIPALRQPVKLLSWEGAPGRPACRLQANYLAKPDGSPLFTTGGEVIETKQAYGVGAKYGQQRIILSPLVTDGLDLMPYATKLASLWGLDEFGWYAACHYDTDNHHIHFVAERATPSGHRIDVTDGILRAWMLHAQALSTNILGLHRND